MPNVLQREGTWRVPLRISSEDREVAIRLLCSMIAFANAAVGTTGVIRLIAWIEARDEEEGGFLWLAGALGYRPSQLEDILRSTMDSNPRRRQSIERRLGAMFWNALND